MVAEFIGTTNFIEGTVSGQQGPFLVLGHRARPLRCQGQPPQAEPSERACLPCAGGHPPQRRARGRRAAQTVWKAS